MLTRRSVIGRATRGALLLQFPGFAAPVSPAEAKRQNVPFQSLTPLEVASLETLGEALLPGARDAGIAQFVDHQVSGAPQDALLVARYFNLKPPYLSFYRAGLSALDAAARCSGAKCFARLSPPAVKEVIISLRDNHVDGWNGPPAPLFYTLVRGDAIDVVYGTEQGFRTLDIPYMAHITPPAAWSK